MTERHLPLNGALQSWRVERAPGAPELTQAGRVAIPVRLRLLGTPASTDATELVLTAEEADALCGELTALLYPGESQGAVS